MIKMATTDTIYKECELRQVQENHGFICLASGGMSLAEMALDEEMPAVVCAKCAVPEQLAIFSCLYQVVVKIQADRQWLTAYLCRWNYNLWSQEKLFYYHASTTFCLGCRDWVPRPPVTVIKDYLAKTREMIAYCTSPPEPTNPLFSSWLDPPPSKRRQSFLNRIKKLCPFSSE